MNELLQTLDLTHVAITASIEASGRLGPVKGLWAKLLAAASKAATVGRVRLVVVAADQTDVPAELEQPQASPLRIVRAATLQEAMQRLYEEHGPQQAVRQYEREHCATLDLLGRSVPLMSHYQVVPVLREVRRTRLPFTPHESEVEARAAALHHGDVLCWEAESRGEYTLYEPLPILRLFADFSGAAREAAGATPRFVVLGPPGSGKTTLLQYLSLQAATDALLVAGRRVLPVRVRVRAWEHVAAHVGAFLPLPMYLAQHYHFLSPAPHLEQWRRWLRHGELLLLIDGVDEMQGAPDFLSRLATELRTYTACPTVVTCRTVDVERLRTLCPGFPVFTLAGLDQSQRRAYINAFPIERREGDKDHALLQYLQREPQLLPLITNPFLLSILCYVADATAPQEVVTTRGELYRQTITRLLTQRAQRVVVQYPGPAPSAHEKIMILQRAALLLFLREQRRLTCSGQELSQALKSALQEEGYGAASAPWANALLTDVLRNSGLLRGDNNQGFSFFHPSIQEFLAAAALASRINSQGWRATLAAAGKQVSVVQLLDKKSWDPQWQEIIVLLSGLVADPLPLLTLLTEKRDDLFQHRLALAAQSLAEVRMDARAGLARLIDQVTEKVISTWLRYETRGVSVAVPHLTRALPALANLGGQVENTPLPQWLQARLREVNPDVRAGVVAALGYIGEGLAHETTLRTALTSCFHDPDVLVRVNTVDALRRIGAEALQHPDTLSALLRAAAIDEDWFVRLSAKRALLQLKETAPRPPDELVAFLNGQTDEPSSLSDNYPLHQIRDDPPLSPESAADLVVALRAPDAGARVRTAAWIKQLETTEQPSDMLSALVELALHDTDSGVRAQAVDTLGGFRTHHAEQAHIVPILATALRDRVAGVRARAAQALGRSPLPPQYRHEALAALLEALEDGDLEVRFAAAEALGQQLARGVRIFRRWWGKREWKTVEELAGL